MVSALRTGPATAPEIAAAADLPPASATLLLEALVQLGACLRDQQEYRLATGLAQVVGPQRAASAFVLAAELAHEFWNALGELPQVARTGQLAFDLQDPTIASRYYRRLARYNSLVFPQYFRLARALAEALPQPTRQPAVWDVGAGSGVWGAAFGEAWHTAQVGFLDRAPVLAQARANAARLGLGDRAWYRDLDLRSDKFGDGSADVLILGQICHTQPATALPDLLRRCAEALRPDGVLVLADLALDPTTPGPPGYVAFAIKELVATGGSILDLDEYHRLLADTGFRTRRCYRFPGLDVFLAARDPSVPLPATVPGAAPDPTEVVR